VNLLPRLKGAWLKVKLPFWAKAALAGLIVGVVGVWLPGVFGTGLSQMKEIFSGTAVPIGMLLALLVAKIILTPNSLGAGFVGGVIGPALLIGSALGAAYGDVALRLFPEIGVSPIAFAMVATAAMLAGTFHAPIFGAMMIFEMNKDYGMLFPLLLAAGIGYAVARYFQPGSAYTFAFPAMDIHLEPGIFTTISKTDERSDIDKD
jgi:CIC family chloride channel protein